MDNSKMSGPSEESKGFIDNELINQDDHQNSHQEEVEDHIIKIQNGENESDDDNSMSNFKIGLNYLEYIDLALFKLLKYTPNENSVI